MKKCVIFNFLISTVTLALAADYCSKDLCQSKGPHIACNNDGKINTKCSEFSELIPLSEKYKSNIVAKHNELRNKIASGKQNITPNTYYKSAARMATITWDNELAKLAELNVKTCEYEHDKCRNTDKYPKAGQNLATKTGHFTPSIEDVYEAIQDWYDEYVYANNEVIQSFTTPQPEKIYGHFTGMVGDNNYKVGCAALKKTLGNGKYELLIACDYANTNILDHPIYVFGEPTAKCETGKNPDYPALCSVKEKYNLKKLFGNNISYKPLPNNKNKVVTPSARYDVSSIDDLKKLYPSNFQQISPNQFQITIPYNPNNYNGNNVKNDFDTFFKRLNLGPQNFKVVNRGQAPAPKPVRVNRKNVFKRFVSFDAPSADDLEKLYPSDSKQDSPNHSVKKDLGKSFKQFDFLPQVFNVGNRGQASAPKPSPLKAVRKNVFKRSVSFNAPSADDLEKLYPSDSKQDSPNHSVKKDLGKSFKQFDFLPQVFNVGNRGQVLATAMQS